MNPWRVKRRRPYTTAGIKRMRCVRCRKQAYSTWQACADGGLHRPLCVDCDVELNRMVLQWMRHPRAATLANRYEKAVRA